MRLGRDRCSQRRSRGGAHEVERGICALDAFGMHTESLDCLEDYGRLLGGPSVKGDASGRSQAAATVGT